MNKLVYILPLIILLSCKGEKKVENPKVAQAKEILEQSIQAHGGDLFEKSERSAMIGNDQHVISRKAHIFEYKVIKKDTMGNVAVDRLTNGGFDRHVNDEPVEIKTGLDSRLYNLMSNQLFIYDLPYSFRDNVFNLFHNGTTSFRGVEYDLVSVNYKEIDGEKEEESYMAYFSKDTHQLHFVIVLTNEYSPQILVYEFKNQRQVDGILFFDIDINTIKRVYYTSPELEYLFSNKAFKNISKYQMTDISVKVLE